MKNIFNQFSFLLTVFASSAVFAQASGSTGSAVAMPIGFVADVGDLFEKGSVSEITDKYDGYVSAKVLFNFNKVKLLVYKSNAADCQLEVCPAIAEIPMQVEFDVKRVEYQGCYVSYYAKTPDNIKATYQEKVVIHRFASERCQKIAEAPEGRIHYKIVGQTSGAEPAEAHAAAKLKNIEMVKVTGK